MFIQIIVLKTIGIDFRIKKVTINKEEYLVQIWDTAGQERYRTITKNFFREANGLVICFDLSNSKSLSKVQEWLNVSMLEYTKGNLSKVLVGTKADLPTFLDEEKLQKYQNDYQIQYFMTSSRTGLNVPETFDYLLNQIHLNLNKKQDSLVFLNGTGKTDEEIQKNINENNFILNKNQEKILNDSAKCRC